MASYHRCVRILLFFPLFESPWLFRSAGAFANPKVYFDVDVGGQDAGRITFELYSDTVPKTVSHSFSSFLYQSIG
jgi:hypothetical protein